MYTIKLLVDLYTHQPWQMPYYATTGASLMVPK